MLLPPREELKQGEERYALINQLQVFIYDSHMWRQTKNETPRVCIWCNKTSSVDMMIDGKDPLLLLDYSDVCVENPAIKDIIKHKSETLF